MRRAAICSLAAASTIAQAQQALQSFTSQYGLGVEITSVSPSSYVTLYDSYSLLAEADLPSLKSYGSLFIDDISFDDIAVDKPQTAVAPAR